MLSRRQLVCDALKHISVSASLAEPAGKVPWQALGRLYDALDGLPGVSLARATKILHKKRPALVPILDDVVVRYLGRVGALPSRQEGCGTLSSREPANRWAGRADRALPAAGNSGGTRALELTKRYHAELQGARPVLTCVQRELYRRGYQLTECRLLDVYLWAYSGTYEPLWKRRKEGEAATVQELPSAHPCPGIAAEGHSSSRQGEASDFWSDDEGYLSWLSSHPAGYVLNCDHQPKASYLKLHRASCSWLHLPNVRSWTRPHMKVCATSVNALDRWASTWTSVSPDRCPTCKP